MALTVGVTAFASQSGGRQETLGGGPLEIIATAFDTGGRPKGLTRQTLELAWPDNVRTTADNRFDALSRIDLPSGEYEIRVAVNSASRTASVFTYLTVPSFAAAPLSLSNIVVGATAGTLTAPRNFLSTLLPLVPTARREFARTDRFVAFFRIYQGTGRDTTLTPVQLQSTLIDTHGAIVATESSAIESAKFANGRGADHYVTLPLATLEPGDYLLKIEAKIGARVAGRALRFQVTP